MGKWEMVRLGDVCERVETEDPTKFEKLIDYIDISSINTDEKKVIDYKTISSKEAPSRARQKVYAGDILVSTVRPNLNAVAVVNTHNNDIIASTGFCVLRIKRELASNQYVFEFTKSPKFVDQLVKQATGASYPAVSNKIVLGEKIPLPPLVTQQKIADILDRANVLIEKRKAQIEKLDLLVKSQFVEMFGDPVMNPMGWETTTWEEVFNTTTGKLDSNAMVENGEYPFFTCAKEVFSIDNYAFDCEALLLAGNNAAGIYDVKHYVGKFNAYQRTYVITLKNNRFSYYPFKLMLEHKLGQMRDLSKGTNTKYLTMGILNEFIFIVPSPTLQTQFATFVERVEAQKTQLKKSLVLLELNYKSLMQKCFEGEIL